LSGHASRAIDILTYLMQHDAHHRGHICLLARDLGHDFSGDDTMRLGGWKAIAPPGRDQPARITLTARQRRAYSYAYHVTEDVEVRMEGPPGS
jgi:glyoxylase-like metal-dependent hydrolase (beta-lactamase superfamily II)